MWHTNNENLCELHDDNTGENVLNSCTESRDISTASFYTRSFLRIDLTVYELKVVERMSVGGMPHF